MLMIPQDVRNIGQPGVLGRLAGSVVGWFIEEEVQR